MQIESASIADHVQHQGGQSDAAAEQTLVVESGSEHVLAVESKSSVQHQVVQNGAAAQQTVAVESSSEHIGE